MLEKLEGKRIGVIGVGVSNRPLIRFLLSKGFNITAFDKDDKADITDLGCDCILGENYLDEINEYDVIFRTPGLKPNLLKDFKGLVTSEMELFLEETPARIIAVTGSDGKTTTTTIIYELLKKQGLTAFVGGNIGSPLVEQLEQMNEESYAVLELSSFQLMTLKSRIHTAVITNIEPNHLDWHTDMQEYIDAKKNIFLFQAQTDRLVINADNKITNEFVGNGETLRFSMKNNKCNGYSDAEEIYINQDFLMDAHDILIVGRHNIENYMAAILAVWGVVTQPNIIAVAKEFSGVEHRLEFVRELDGVRYFNDSIGTSPTRTIAGLNSFNQKVILIAGGYDKKIPFDSLGIEICRHVKILILTGDTSEKIKKATIDSDLEPPVIIDAIDLETAINLASQEATAGDVVLLSPACAAFDRFKNFMVRGKLFKELVNKL